ncbi:MAG: hypothetical protein AAB528_06130, partial [Chloroflexota bacterium]
MPKEGEMAVDCRRAFLVLDLLLGRLTVRLTDSPGLALIMLGFNPGLNAPEVFCRNGGQQALAQQQGPEPPIAPFIDDALIGRPFQVTIDPSAECHVIRLLELLREIPFFPDFRLQPSVKGLGLAL